MPEQRRRTPNPLMRDPLLRKGGPHQPGRSSERRQQRQALEMELEHWWEEQEDDDTLPGDGD
ncbi:MAG: hypothetical protein P8171_01165 [Candidatus Thiodiazotropha sp.]|jgi:hypothetical protein